MRPRLLAMIEVLGVLALGWLLTRLLLQLLPLPPLETELERAVLAQRPDLLRLAALAVVPLTLQAACLLVPAHVISRFLRGESFLGSPGPVRRAAGIPLTALTAFCFAALPMRGLLVVNEVHPLGKEPYYWELFHKPWGLGFWVFMAVGSFVLIPVLEELVYRGYCQTRLERAFGGTGAVVGTSVLFAVVHFQYYRADVLNVGMVLSLFVVSLGIGAAYLATRSILAPMLVHSLMNVPATAPWDLAFVGVMVVGAVVLRKRSAGLVRPLTAGRVRHSDALYLLVVGLFSSGMALLPIATTAVFIVGMLSALTIAKRTATARVSGTEAAD
jgi:membrane protease YdiL (CAAX protease family)